MSASELDRQLLLSAALDGALDTSEQKHFEQLLQTDPALAQEWEELQSLRRDLKSSLSQLRRQQPAPDLAARIVATAFAADRSGATVGSTGSRSSSVVPVSVVPSPATTPEPSRPWYRETRLVGALALAASLMLMVTWLTSSDSDTPDPNLPTAPQLLADANLNQDPAADPSVADPSAARIDQEPATATNNSLASRAERSPASDSVTPVFDQEADQDSAMPPALAVRDSVPPQAGESSSAPGVMASDAIASADTASPDVASPDRAPLQVLLVFSVQVTEQGREQLALQNALRTSGIRLGTDTLVSDQVVGQLRQSQVITDGEADADAAKLFYIEGSAKKIDRLISEMLNQPAMFASVSMSLATEPPLLASVSELPVNDPTKVRSSIADGIAVNMVSSDRRPLGVSSSYPFLPVDRDMAQMGVGGINPAANASLQNAADFTSQLLLIVR